MKTPIIATALLFGGVQVALGADPMSTDRIGQAVDAPPISPTVLVELENIPPRDAAERMAQEYHLIYPDTRVVREYTIRSAADRRRDPILREEDQRP